MGFFDKFIFSNITESIGNKLAGILQFVEKQISDIFNTKQNNRNNRTVEFHQSTVSYNLPIGISRALTSTNPYLAKYRNNRKEEAVYLLYCDYSAPSRWIKDTTKADVFFNNYITAIQILEAIIDRDCYNAEPKEQLHKLKLEYTKNVNFFVTRLWNSTLEAAQKLKTEKGKQNKVQKFFDTLLAENAEYLTAENIAFINTFRNKSINEVPQVIKQPVECGNYDVSTIESIERIPNNSFDVIRPLQKAATAHKRNGDIDLAIACLKKSNEISDNAPHRENLLQKEYLRVLSYIKLLDKPDLLKAEEDRIKQVHPEFWDKRISARRKIQEGIETCNRFDNDLIEIFTNSHCPICSKYNHQIYSISGTHKIHPKLPDVVLNQTHECKECIWGVGSFYEGINSPPIK